MNFHIVKPAMLLLLCTFLSCQNRAQQELPTPQLQNQSISLAAVPSASSVEAQPLDSSTKVPCEPEFQPAPMTVNNCLNHCQYVYEGWVATHTESPEMEVNCISNPVNWSLSIKHSGEQSYFQLAVQHPPIDYQDYPQGAGLCSRDLIFEPLNPDYPCLPFWEFEQIGEGDQNGTTAILNLWMPTEFWDCCEPTTFQFRVTARMELPIWQN